MSNIPKGKQGTLISGVWYSRISAFSLIEVFLNFLKYLRRFLFSSMVVTALSCLVLYLCRMTGSRF